jgi:zinc protease
MADLSAATEQDVKDFFRLYYAPNDAFLAIAGDFDPAVGEKHDDTYALDVPGAVLSGPRTARITKALAYDQQAAASVMAGQRSNEDVGEFMLIITPRPGHSLTDLEAAADAVIERLKQEGPTAEGIRRAPAGEELRFLRGLESNLGKAMQLCDGAGFHGDPGHFKTACQKSQAVTAADVKRVANKYLTNGLVVLSVVPTGKLDQASKPAESKKVPGAGEPGQEVQR